MQPRTPHNTLTSQRTLLTVTAAVLSTLVAVQVLGGAPPIGPRGNDSSSAHAGMVSSAGGHTVMTADGNNEDLLLVLDERSEELFVYRTDVNKGVQLFQRMSLPEIFSDARARAVGR